MPKSYLPNAQILSDPWAGVAGGMAPPQQQTNDWGAGADVSPHHLMLMAITVFYKMFDFM